MARRTLIQLTPAGVAMQARIREVWLTFDGELRREAGPSLNLATFATIEGPLEKEAGPPALKPPCNPSVS